jgi:hypothetical protein
LTAIGLGLKLAMVINFDTMPEEQTKDLQDLKAIERPEQDDEELSDEELEGVAGGRPKGSKNVSTDCTCADDQPAASKGDCCCGGHGAEQSAPD